MSRVAERPLPGAARTRRLRAGRQGRHLLPDRRLRRGRDRVRQPAGRRRGLAIDAGRARARRARRATRVPGEGQPRRPHTRRRPVHRRRHRRLRTTCIASSTRSSTSTAASSRATCATACRPCRLPVGCSIRARDPGSSAPDQGETWYSALPLVQMSTSIVHATAGSLARRSRPSRRASRSATYAARRRRGRGVEIERRPAGAAALAVEHVERRQGRGRIAARDCDGRLCHEAEVGDPAQVARTWARRKPRRRRPARRWLCNEPEVVEREALLDHRLAAGAARRRGCPR